MLNIEHLHQLRGQNIADMLKGALDRNARYATATHLASAYDHLRAFEGAGWHAVAFEHAAREHAPAMELDFDGGRFVFIDTQRASIVQMVTNVMRAYLTSINAQLPVESPDELLTMVQAAEYLGLTMASMKKYLNRIGSLKPTTRIGRSYLFSRADLDAFQATRRPVGRPKEHRI